MCQLTTSITDALQQHSRDSFACVFPFHVLVTLSPVRFATAVSVVLWTGSFFSCFLPRFVCKIAVFTTWGLFPMVEAARRSTTWGPDSSIEATIKSGYRLSSF